MHDLEDEEGGANRKKTEQSSVSEEEDEDEDEAPTGNHSKSLSIACLGQRFHSFSCYPRIALYLAAFLRS